MRPGGKRPPKRFHLAVCKWTGHFFWANRAETGFCGEIHAMLWYKNKRGGTRADREHAAAMDTDPGMGYNGIEEEN